MDSAAAREAELRATWPSAWLDIISRFSDEEIEAQVFKNESHGLIIGRTRTCFQLAAALTQHLGVSRVSEVAGGLSNAADEANNYVASCAVLHILLRKAPTTKRSLAASGGVFGALPFPVHTRRIIPEQSAQQCIASRRVQAPQQRDQPAQLLRYIESRRAAMADKRLEIPRGLNHRLQKLERELRAGADSSAAGALAT
jgi:hypothetical protein